MPFSLKLQSNCQTYLFTSFVLSLHIPFFFLILRQHSDSDSHCREARETSKQESLSGSFPMAVLQLDLDHTVFSASDPEPLKRITSRHTFLSSTVDRLEKQSFKCSDSYHYCPSAGHMHTLSTVCEHNSFRLFSFHTWS